MLSLPLVGMVSCTTCGTSGTIRSYNAVAFLKEAVNKFPDLIGTTLLCTLMFPYAAYNVRNEERKRPFTYRLYYTVWRPEDPRSNQMLKKMEKYNWKPEMKPDAKAIEKARKAAGFA
ncbi:uncharacterized protein LOC111267760 isoform X1 [Varroa jacobsoni]|uniref:uncharacterized protein LOC111267760 isoform X1 n=1 Tax=Varroa jacobsoni TaxID=62625 RepID=UPI000BF358B1|nr:uncharacterized protein LOC111267760 isoform X1 [Varroa jacobsoni]